MRKINYFQIYIFSAALLLAPVFFAQAAPSVNGVTGNVSEGQAITINGTGFGATGPNILVFDDFEKGNNNSPISANSTQVGQWSSVTGPNITYSTDYRHSGSNAMKLDFISGTSNGQVALYFPGATDIFFSWWQYIPVGKDVPGTNNVDGPNWKWFWLGDGDTGWPWGSDYVVVTLDNFFGNNIFLAADDTDPPVRAPSPVIYMDTLMNKGDWVRESVYMKNSTTQSGVYWLQEVDGVHPVTVPVNGTGVTAHAGELWTVLTLPGYGRTDNNSIVYFDDAYVATGAGARARVEIGNAATYNASTNLTILTPTAWTASSITATVRKGSISNGSSYLYITDANGNVNATGYSVFIAGGAPDTTAPTVPTGLTATPISSSQINLSWTASTDAVGVAGYRIYRGGMQIATSSATGTTYSNTGLTASTLYSYTVSAYDLARNFSAQSSAVSATTQAPAGPSVSNVSGVFSNGQTINITGSNFGTNAANQEWTGDNIENGTVGSLFSKTNWLGMDEWSPVLYANDQAHSGTKSIKTIVDPSTSWNGLYAYHFVDPVNPGDMLYMTWWVRANSTAAGQWKMLRLSQNDTVVDGSQEYLLFNWNNANGCQRVIDLGTANEQVLWQDAGFPQSNQTWQRVELIMQASGANQTNGHSILGRFNGADYESYDWTGHKNFTAAGQQYNYALFQNFIGNGIPGTLPIWSDDIFIQNGIARVELCNSSTWSNRNHCEIQPRTAWNSSAITITFNTGSFASGQTAYIYIVDSNGNVNAAGYPATINGGSSDTTAPTVPTGLTATAISSSQINLSWTASTDAVGVAGYRIYRGGVQIATSSGTGTTYSDTGLTAATQYSYRVSAYDAARNFSAQCTAVQATTLAASTVHYVSANGAATWAQSTNVNTPCSLSTANTNATAGDTVYFRGGTYTINGDYVEAVHPTHSGTSGNLLTYAAYTGEHPLILRGTGGDAWGLSLSGISYFKLDGFIIKNFPRWGTLTNFSNHNEIANCTFTGDTGEEGSQGLQIVEGCSGGSSFLCPSTNNWIHNNTFSKLHTTTAPNTCVEGADLVRIGYGDGTGDSQEGNNYNTIENNVMEYAGHTTFDGYGMYTVFRNNIMHNEPWWGSFGTGCTYSDQGYSNPNFVGKYGHRTFQITDGYHRYATYNLVEGNRSGFGSANPGNDGADGMDIAAPRNIVRYNDIFAAMNDGLMFKYGWISGNGGNGGTYNRVYNNTIYHNGYGNPWYESSHNGVSTSPEPLLAIRFYYSDTTVGNVVKNNLIYDSRRYALSGFDIGTAEHNSTYDSSNIVTNNWLTSSGNPNFTNPDVSDPTSLTLPNLTLQSNSGAINGGTYLTQANGSGNNATTLIVDDALYFQDGSWGSDLARNVDFFADWIAIGTVNNVVQISSINYNTNTITIASPKTWSDNAPVWLYKDSSGKVVLSGAAPDYGAHEYLIAATDTIAPSVPTGLTATAISSSQINLSWSASTDAVGVTGYRVYRGGVQIATSTGTGTTYSNTGLTASTLYSYTVSAYDAVRNFSAQSSAASATTQAPPDIAAPTVPTGLAVTLISGKEVDLSWASSTDNVGVAGYKIYRGATQIATTTGTTYIDTTGNPATAYSYKVAAFDAARNVSAQSTALAVTTGHEYFIDPTNGNDDATGLGTSAAWKTFRNIFSYRGDKTGALSYKSHLVTPSSGDIFYVMDGTINTLYRPGDDSGAAGVFGTAGVTGNPAILYFRGVSGTAIAPIKIAAYPGAHPILDPQYNGEGFSVLQSNYLDFSGIVIKNSMTAGEGGGIGIESVNYIKVHDVEVYDTDGVDNNNMSGLHCLSSTNVEIYNSIFHDNYDRTAADSGGITTPNSTNLVFFGGGNISVHDNLIYQTPQPIGTVNSGAGIKYKAASADANAYFKIYNNVFRNCKFFSIESGTGNTSVHNNIIIGGNTGVVFDDPANYTRLMNELVENNTFYNLAYSNNPALTEAAFSFYPTLYWNTRGYPGSVSNIIFRNNIVYDTGSYAAEHTPVYMYGYIDDTLYNASMPELHINNNCYYNSASNPLLFSLAYATSYGALGGTYNWTQWRALTWTNPANSQTQALNFDANSVNVNPQFIAIDTNLSSYNPSSNAFRPAPGSPAINMGAYAGLSVSTSTPSDTTPPTGSVAINSNAAYTNNVSTILTLLANDISGVTQMKLSDVSTNFSSLSALAFSSPYSWTLLGLDGVKTVYAWFSDSLGNWNNTPFSDTIILDRLSPDITNINVTNISANSATLTWTTSELAQANIDYGLTSGYGQSTTEESTPVTTHSTMLSGLSSATNYNFRINATDRAGNRSVSINQTFRTATTSIPDTIPPAQIANLSANNILSTSADLHWTASGDDNNTGLARNYILKYSTTAISNTNTQTEINNWWKSANLISQSLIPKLSGQAETFTILNLASLTNYYFAIQAQDEANNTSTISNILNLATPAAPVVTPPSNGGGGGSSGGGSSGGGSSGSLSNTTNTTEAPTHFLAIGAKNQVYLSWSNPINTNFVGVKLYRKLNSALTSQTDAQGKMIFQGTQEQFNDLNIPTSSQYYYTIYAYDRSSHYSNPVTVSATLDQAKQTIAIPAPLLTKEGSGEVATPAQGAAGGGQSAKTSLVGVKSSEVETITRSESQDLVQNSRSILFSAVTMKIYQKIIVLSEKPQTDDNKFAIANFIHTGTPTTVVTGAGERGGSIASFRSAFGRLPETATDWQDVIKIANGRWPSQRNIAAEAKVQGDTFAKIYGRTANLKNTNDSNAVTVMTYGLRPAQRNTASEKAAIKAFRYVFHTDPTSASDWDVVRAIAYSGAKR